MSDRLKGRFLAVNLGLFFLLSSSPVMAAAEEAVASGSHAWWFWPLILLIVTFVMGIFAVLGGVGGGVLFVPIISGFFPFHLDFVRGTGLLVALSGALAAGPGLLKMNLASLRLAIPVALLCDRWRHDRIGATHKYCADPSGRHHCRHLCAHVDSQEINIP